MKINKNQIKRSESNKVIEKNAEIKQNIINSTQGTILLQEQLLETEKNLKKIKDKIDDLNSKNKHLEQIRFVLEHRMTSLEDEKKPLEGQCLFLENQKNNVQEEFNKVILEINEKNQKLQNKQQELKACLIQNFEVNDQINYMQKKLIHLHKELVIFINRHREKHLLIQDNKAVNIAIQLKAFYDKIFNNPIEIELKNYHYHLQKLLEDTEKRNTANNMDLIIRDKAEEKLITDKRKYQNLTKQKQRVHTKMQTENTLLIAECNRLRKNLHEVYQEVMKIENDFLQLTKINPELGKAEIVKQINMFIRDRHDNLRNYNKSEDEEIRIEEEIRHTDSKKTLETLRVK